MSIENPFKIFLKIRENNSNLEEDLSIYSVQPLKKILNKIINETNTFIVGEIGVGKTMILLSFDPFYQELLFLRNNESKENEERQQIFNMLPNNVIGVYLNLHSPLVYLEKFQGSLLSKIDWIKCFGDYFGMILLENFIKNFELIEKNSKLNLKSHINLLKNDLLDIIALKFKDKINSEIADSNINLINNWNTLKKYIEMRKTFWVHSINEIGGDIFTGPKSIIDFILPCQILFNLLKEQGILSKECRIYIIIDQYEKLFDHRKTIDFRPIFNSAMSYTHRHEPSIEFKIGVRPYGYVDNLDLFQSDVKLDLKKNEATEIFIDDIIPQYYSDFIRELTTKCLKKSVFVDQIDNFNNIFEKLDYVKELEAYMGNSINEKQFAKFFLTIPKIESQKIIDQIKILSQKYSEKSKRILAETLLAIISEKYYSKRRRDFSGLFKELYKYNEAIEKFFFSHINDDEENDNSDISNNRITELLEGAMFILASSYQIKKKIYSGFNSIRICSSNKVWYFVKILYDIFQQLTLKQKSYNNIPASIQSSAIYKISTEFYRQIKNSTSNGIAITYFLDNLGAFFYMYQLSPKVDLPSPNRIIIEKPILTIFDSNEKEYEYLLELLNYGFIKEELTPDRYRKKNPYRNKCSLEKLLCPYFQISIKNHKTGIYIKGSGKELLLNLFDEHPEIIKLQKSVLDDDNTKYGNILDYFGEKNVSY